MRSVLTRMSIGKLSEEAASSNFTGKVIVSLPEGEALPLSTSATLFPPSWPACHAQRMASGADFQEAVSITPPILSTTTTFFPAAWKASDTAFNMFCSSLVRLKSATIRSRNSPEVRPSVTSATSALAACSRMTCAETAISAGRVSGMNHSFLSLDRRSFSVFK